MLQRGKQAGKRIQGLAIKPGTASGNTERDGGEGSVGSFQAELDGLWPQNTQAVAE